MLRSVQSYAPKPLLGCHPVLVTRDIGAHDGQPRRIEEGHCRNFIQKIARQRIEHRRIADGGGDPLCTGLGDLSTEAWSP